MGAPPRIPDYELLRMIGQGSYGDVWLARGVTGIYRAIKVVWRERFADAGPFEREFHGLKEFAAISLGESIQLALLHIGRNDEAGFFYYVMELADDAERGREIDPARYAPLTLAEMRRRSGRIPVAECVTFGVELARVLAGLHSRGLVHRDIKPSNVILVGGVPKLADIGLVTPASSARTFVGTEGFVPPEGPGSPRADVFALGKLLYELSTGLDRQQFPRLPPGAKPSEFWRSPIVYRTDGAKKLPWPKSTRTSARSVNVSNCSRNCSACRVESPCRCCASSPTGTTCARMQGSRRCSPIRRTTRRCEPIHPSCFRSFSTSALSCLVSR